MVRDDMKSCCHVNNRLSKATAICLKIKKKGYLKNASPETLAQIHKTYIRPVLYYGLDALVLNKNDLSLIKKFESNSIKTALALMPRLRTSPLMQALGIDSTQHRLKLIKLNFYGRLLSNDYTVEFIQNLVTSYKTKIPQKSALRGLTLEMRPGLSLRELSIRCKIKQAIMKNNFQKKCKSDRESQKIRKMLNNLEENRDSISAKLLAF